MKTINEKGPCDYGYIATCGLNCVGVYAKTSYDAQKMAAEALKAKTPWDVSIYVVERPSNVPVSYAPTM